jgi:hypothetical protein
MQCFIKIAVKSNKQGIYQQQLHNISAKSAKFGYKCIFISSPKTFIYKDILSRRSEQKVEHNYKDNNMDCSS